MHVTAGRLHVYIGEWGGGGGGLGHVCLCRSGGVGALCRTGADIDTALT